MTRKTLLLALFASTALILPGLSAGAQAACLSDREIQAAVASGQILPLNAVMAQAGLPPGTKVLPPVQVCDQGGQLFYTVNVLEGGQARTISLNARTGRP